MKISLLPILLLLVLPYLAAAIDLTSRNEFLLPGKAALKGDYFKRQTLSNFLQTRYQSIESKILDIRNYTKIINILSFYGNWYSNSASFNGFDEFTNNRGYMQMTPADSKQTFDDEHQWKVDFAFFNGKYQDQGYAQISVDVPTSAFQINQDNATLYLNGAALQVEYGYDFESQSESVCTTNMAISFIDLQNSKPFTEFDDSNTSIENIGVWVSFEGVNCTISVSSQTLKVSDVTN